MRDNLRRVVQYAENHLKTANPNSYTEAELQDLREVLDYAADDEKTARQFYVTGINCTDVTAYAQMTATKLRFGKTGGNLAYHAYQSFPPEEVSPEQCHRIGVELAKSIWGDRYEVLVSTHLNTHCVHNHFVINSVSFVDGKKLNNNYAMYFKNLRAESDRICSERGLYVIDEPLSRGAKYLQQAEKNGEMTYNAAVKLDIDEAIQMAMTDNQFYWVMKKWGYSFNLNPSRKYPTVTPPGAKKAIRLYHFGDDYTPEGIRHRILSHGRPYLPPPPPPIKQYQYRGSFNDMKYTSGLYVLYLIISMLLRKFSNRAPASTRPVIYTPELRAEIRKLDKYCQQTRLLAYNKINTPEQLQTFIEKREQQAKALIGERNRIYNKIRSAKTPEAVQELREQRNAITETLAPVFKDLRLARDIQERHRELAEKVRAERALRAQRLALEKPQTIKHKERGYER